MFWDTGILLQNLGLHSLGTSPVLGQDDLEKLVIFCFQRAPFSFSFFK